MDILLVILGAAINMALGFFWYSEGMFGSIWAAAHHKDIKDLKPAVWQIVADGALSLVLAWGLLYFVDRTGATTIQGGALVGFVAWLAFIATTHLSAVVWMGKTTQSLFVEAGMKLLSYVIIAAVFGIIR